MGGSVYTAFRCVTCARCVYNDGIVSCTSCGKKNGMENEPIMLCIYCSCLYFYTDIRPALIFERVFKLMTLDSQSCLFIPGPGCQGPFHPPPKPMHPIVYRAPQIHPIKPKARVFIHKVTYIYKFHHNLNLHVHQTPWPNPQTLEVLVC